MGGREDYRVLGEPHVETILPLISSNCIRIKLRKPCLPFQDPAQLEPQRSTIAEIVQLCVCVCVCVCVCA